MVRQEVAVMALRARSRGIAVLAFLLILGVQTARAQEGSGARVVPTNHVVLSGYGTIGYFYQTTGTNNNAFLSSVNPIFLYQFQDRVLFEVELEFEIEDGITETGLEYAQLDFIASNNLTLVGGKFLLPWGVFGDRIHPTWINKFASSPIIYGHGASGLAVEPITPVLSDVGVMARGAWTPGRFAVALNGYITQGPQAEGADSVPEIELPASSSDNNTDKSVGGRLDLALPPWAELNFSYLTGNYDDQNVLDLTLWNVAGEVRYSDFELRGEYIQRRQEIETLAGFPVQVRDGLYAQVSYRRGSWESVARWSQIFDTELDGVVVEKGIYQVGLGLDYWFAPSIALMVGYEFNRESGPKLDNDRLITHVAFGF